MYGAVPGSRSWSSPNKYGDSGTDSGCRTSDSLAAPVKQIKESFLMFRRREAVPFSFVAESERFRSNVTPPPAARATVPELLGRALVGLTVVAGLVGSVLVGLPALDSGQSAGHDKQSTASQER
ncbi:hypothetical protein GCM10010231_32850 [Streptomyces sindenensis]|nr:hypothetical protein GCM10010231_32850 [Streptomyces sindenensis]